MNTKLRTNPFRVGGPVQDPKDFAGRQEILQEISHGMLNLQNISLRGERRTGKTSLLLYLSRGAPETTGLPDDHIAIYVDFQDLAESSVVEVWEAIANAIAGKLREKIKDGQTQSEKFIKVAKKYFSTKAFASGFAAAFAELPGVKIHLLFDVFEQTAKNCGRR